MNLSPKLPGRDAPHHAAGCNRLLVGPHYKRPSAAAPPAFKEQAPVNFKEAEAAGWKQSQPGDAYSKGRWWELYNDAALNALEEQVGVSNQNVLEAEAQYRQAKAAVSVARAALLPVVTADPTATVGGPGNRKSFNLPFNIAWEAGSMGKHPPRCDGQRGPPPSLWRPAWEMPGCCTRPNWRKTTSACTATTPKRSYSLARRRPIRSTSR